MAYAVNLVGNIFGVGLLPVGIGTPFVGPCAVRLVQGEIPKRKTAEEIIRAARAKAQEQAEAKKPMVLVDENNKRVKNPRNLPCACGSGKKFKKCCGANR